MDAKAPVDLTNFSWNVPPVASHDVVTITDRQVRVSAGGDVPSLYAQCRQWVQNNPDAPYYIKPDVRLGF